MTDEKILNALAPCGISCEKCFAYTNGDIRKFSVKLKEKLGNFEPYAKRFETLLDNPVFSKYPDFKMQLDYFASETCTGCRKETCKIFSACGVRSCHREKGVDFCFECNEFPCNNTNFDENLHNRWIKLNNEMREKGIEAYYAETKDKPRY